MNEVYMEGVIVAVDKPEAKGDQNHHLVCQLRMTHRTRQGQLKHELYTVNAWNRLADWAEKHIATGTPVFIKGYLTQRNHSGAAAVEITASRFVIRQTGLHSEESQSSPSDA
ncbi:MAG: single-stranded DNA-binding protein [Clostridia bacterium]|nr:single-stranded DNA-binding protein [Clostridia bacterium]